MIWYTEDMLRSNAWRKQLQRRRWGVNDDRFRRGSFDRRVDRRIDDLNRRIAPEFEVPSDDEVVRGLIGVGATDEVIHRLLPGRYTTEALSIMRRDVGYTQSMASLRIGMAQITS